MVAVKRVQSAIWHERFANEYLVDFNATAAYMRVYPNANRVTAGKNGYKLLKRPEIQAMITKAQKAVVDRIQAKAEKESPVAIIKRMEISADRVLQEWARIAFGDIREIFDDRGAMVDPKKLEAHVAAAISSIEFTSRPGQGAVTAKVRHHDKNHALEMLAKHLGILKDQPPPAQWNLDPATLGKMSTEDLEKALKHAEMVQNLLAGKPTP